MADVLVKPAFVSLVPDTGDVTKLGANHWNAARLFSGGVDGDVITRSAASATGAAWSAASSGLPTGVAVGSVLVSNGVGVAPVFSATPTLAGITAGTLGQPTTSTFRGTVGIKGGAGSGLVGIGGNPIAGYGLYLDVGTGNVLGTAGNELIGGQFSAANWPTAPTIGNTAAFGLVALGSWGGAANSLADGLVYGAQLTGQVTGTPSVRVAYGAEATVRGAHTAGTIAQAIGAWAHVDNQSTGLIAEAVGVYAQALGSGITTGIGVHISGVAGANAYGLKITDVTAGTVTNHAIFTGAGKVHFGGALDVVDATITTLVPTASGIISISTGSAPGGLAIKGSTGQSQNLIDAKINGVSKFVVTNGGALSVMGGDMEVGPHTAIFGSAHSLRIGAGEFSLEATARINWAVDTHAYSAKDVGITRRVAGVLKVTNASSGYGTVDALAYQVSGVAGASKAAGPVTSITVVNGIVTACS